MLDMSFLRLSRRYFIGWVFLLIAVFGSWAVFWCTDWGPDINSDSMAYIFSAQNWIRGQGLGMYAASGDFQPLTLHAPLYSILLGILGTSGVDPVILARWLGIFSMGVTLFFIGRLLYHHTGSGLVAIIFQVVWLCFPIVVPLYGSALSDPVFICFWVIASDLLLEYFYADRKIFLVLAAILGGLGVLTRYIGIAFVVTSVLFIVIFVKRPLKKRLCIATMLGGISLIPSVMWWVYSSLTFPTSPRTLELAVPLNKVFHQVFLTVVTWILAIWTWLPFTVSFPYRVKFIILVLLFVLFLGLTWQIAKRFRRQGRDWRKGLALPGMFALGSVAYLGLLLFSILFTRPVPDLNARTMLPAQLASLLVMFGIFALAKSVGNKFLWSGVILVIGSLYVFILFPKSLEIVTDHHTSGVGYLSSRWINSETIQSVKTEFPNRPIISNNPEVIYFLTGRPCYGIREIELSLETRIALDSRYGDDPSDAVQQIFRERGAALIVFNNLRWQFQGLYGKQYEQRLQAFTDGLSVYREYPDGKIYFYPEE